MDESMDEIFAPLIDMFQSGAWLIFRTLLFYIIIPEIVMMILVGFVFRIRGNLFGIIMILITIIVGYIFYTYGLPYIVEESTKLANGI